MAQNGYSLLQHLCLCQCGAYLTPNRVRPERLEDSDPPYPMDTGEPAELLNDMRPP